MTTGLLLSAAAPAAPVEPAGPAPAVKPAEQPAAVEPAAVPAALAPAADRSATPHLFRGRGFDTCDAPPLATMRAWRASSPYRAAGIYFGGRARSCKKQRNLTPGWVRQTTAAGWALIPIYVGSQSPCVSAKKNPYRIDPSRAWAQGTGEGGDAVRTARALGLLAGSALYLDMEGYNASKPRCADPTLTFVRGWDRRVRAAGYLAGFYGSADSGVHHMDRARAAGIADLPDAVWYARWGVRPNVTREPSLSSTAWTPHARIHQYSGAHRETYGGKRLSVDRDLLDAPVGVVR